MHAFFSSCSLQLVAGDREVCSNMASTESEADSNVGPEQQPSHSDTDTIPVPDQKEPEAQEENPEVSKVVDEQTLSVEQELQASEDEGPPADVSAIKVDASAQGTDVDAEATEVQQEPASEADEQADPQTEAEAEADNDGGEQEEEKPRKLTVDDLKTAPMDFRFPTTNQAKHCFTRYIEYHKCVQAKGEDPDCNKYARYYRSLCPGEWIDRWNEQRENGTFPGPL